MFVAFLHGDGSLTHMAFASAAVFGSMFFILRVIMVALVGLGDEMDIEFDTDADSAVDSAEAGEVTEASFKLFSINALAVFIMMFGWAGLSAFVDFGFGAGVSIAIALVIGLITMAITAWLLMKMKGLQSSGDIFNIKELVGSKAEVYQRIPADGIGKVQVTLNGTLRELEAESIGQDEIESFSFVEITGARSKDRVLVKALEDE